MVRKPKAPVRQRMYQMVKGEREQFCPLFASLLGELSLTKTEFEGPFHYTGVVRSLMQKFASALDQYGQGKLPFESVEQLYLDCRGYNGFPGWLITNLADMMNVTMHPNGRVAAYILNDLTHIGRLDPERTFAVVNLIFHEDNVQTAPIAGGP